MKENLGLVHIYCGDGKGKSTASFGLIIRALGCGYKVLLVQFLKDDDTNEIKFLSKVNNLKIISGQDEIKKFTWNMTEEELIKVKEIITNRFINAIDLCVKDNYDVVVFDEIIGAIQTKMLDSNLVLNFIKNKPQNLEVVMTGRNPEEELIKVADYVSEIKKIKHPFDKKISAREGIEK